MTHKRRFRIPLLASAVALALTATPVHADPLSTAIVGTILAGTWSPVLAAVLTFVVSSALVIGINMLANTLFGPSQRQRQQERQASVVSLSIGEVPREAIFGEIATGSFMIATA